MLMKHWLHKDMNVSMAGNIDQKVKNRLIKFLLKDNIGIRKSLLDYPSVLLLERFIPNLPASSCKGQHSSRIHSFEGYPIHP